MAHPPETTPFEKTTATKSTRAAGEVRQFVKLMNTRAHQAKAEGKQVAWAMYTPWLQGPILRAMDITTVYTENYAGLCAAKKKSSLFIDRAEADGYASDICGYARIGLGHSALRKEGLPLSDFPDGGMPDPDFLIGSSAACDPRFKWYEATGRFTNSPVFNYDELLTTPSMCIDDEASREYSIRYQVDQLHRLVMFLEQQTGRRMDQDRLREAYKLDLETYKLYHEVCEMRSAVPCPMPSQDAFSTMVPRMFLAGEEIGYDFVRRLRDEVKERVEGGIGAVQNEQYRLLFAGGLPPWHHMNIFDYFAAKGAVFVMEAAYNYGTPYDEFPVGSDDPIEQVVRRLWAMQWDRYGRGRQVGDHGVQQTLEWIEKYRVDGVVYHAARSCRAMTVGHLFQMQVLAEHTKTPSLLIQSDIIDARDYSEAQTKLRIDAFLETVDGFKRRSVTTG